MTEPNAPHQLEYATPKSVEPWWKSGPRGALRAWQWLPLPLAAVILIIPGYVLLYGFDRCIFYVPSYLTVLCEFLLLVPLFLAAAIRTGRWRSIGVSMLFCIASFVLSGLMLSPVLRVYVVYRIPVAAFIELLAFGLLFWISLEHRERGAVISMALTAAGVASAISLIDIWLLLSDRRVKLDYWGWEELVVIHSALFVIAGGCLMPRAARAKWETRRGRMAGIASILSVTVVVILLGPMLVPMARQSVAGLGPFMLEGGVGIIDHAGKTSDLDCLYDVLERSGYASNDQCIEILTRRDPVRLAERASSRFRARPSLAMAATYAQLFGAQRRYETVPLLVRFSYPELIAITDSGNISRDRPGAGMNVTRALESMGVPQVAPVIDRYEYYWERHFGDGKSFDEVARKRLARLLGSDAGSDPLKWWKLIENTVTSAPTPLNPGLRRETVLEARACEEYISALLRLLVKGIDAHTVTTPNFDVKTTSEFAREVDLYVKRVDEAITSGKSSH